MAEGDGAASANWGPLASVLLEFGQAPGRFSLRLGEPPLLHARLDTVALWAMGRIPPPLQVQSAALQEAAIAFVKRACFAPDNTHYQVLGLKPEAINPATLRARYRTLIRLAHPDMGVCGLPHDAAGLVNRAHEVLGSAVRRSTYDQQLAQTGASLRAVPQPAQAPFAQRNLASEQWLHGSVYKGKVGRWQAWTARFPGLVRFCVVAGSTGVLVAAVLAWAALDAQDSSSLVVARTPQEDRGPKNPQQPAPAAALPAGKNKLAPAPVSVPAAPSRPASNMAAAPAADSAQTKPLRPVPLQLALSASAAARPVPLPASERPAGPAPVQSRSAQPLDAPVPPSVPVSVPLAEPVPLEQMAPVQPTNADLPAPAFEEAPPTGRPARMEAALQTGPALKHPVAEAVSAQPLPAPGLPGPGAAAEVAAVDPAQARSYLVKLLRSLERQADAQRAQAYLTRMNVHGNLLASPLRLAQQHPFLQVERIALAPARSETVSSAAPAQGKLVLAGTMQLHAGNAPATPGHVASYRVLAQFIATEKGPALAQLDLWEVMD